MEVSGGVASVSFRTYFTPQLPNIAVVIVGFSSTGMHEKKSLIHSL